MMANYISREAAIEAVKHAWAKGLEPSQYIEILPAADVSDVVHGRKIEDGGIGCFWLCSLCGKCLPYGANYCPNCGAKMDGGNEGE